MVIEYPFNIEYKSIKQDIVKLGATNVKNFLIYDCQLSETVANVIIKQALKRGWGS